MGKTKIEWAERVWNPVTGCTHAGTPGCDNCYAKRMANRLRGRAGYPEDDPFKVTVHEDKLLEPSLWTKPSAVFVSSMGDLFHPDVSFVTIARIWRVMRFAERQTFLVLTKRPERMREFLESVVPIFDTSHQALGTAGIIVGSAERWPLPNVWLGTSVENQECADLRIPELLRSPAAKHFLSCEPLLGEVDLTRIPMNVSNFGPGSLEIVDSLSVLDWVIAGGESGAGARQMNAGWARSLRDQCAEAGVPFFFKQWGMFTEFGAKTSKKKAGRLLDGREYNETPEF